VIARLAGEVPPKSVQTWKNASRIAWAALPRISMARRENENRDSLSRC
jgi:hypothetical protein